MRTTAIIDCGFLNNRSIVGYERRETVPSLTLCSGPAYLYCGIHCKADQSVWQTLWQTSPSTDG